MTLVLNFTRETFSTYNISPKYQINTGNVQTVFIIFIFPSHFYIGFFQNAFYTCNILPIYSVIPGDMVQWTAHNISPKGKKWYIMLRGYKRAKWWLWAIEVCTSNLLPVSFSFACHHLNRKVDRTMEQYRSFFILVTKRKMQG